jgi:hypothetical protein
MHRPWSTLVGARTHDLFFLSVKANQAVLACTLLRIVFRFFYCISMFHPCIRLRCCTLSFHAFSYMPSVTNHDGLSSNSACSLMARPPHKPWMTTNKHTSVRACMLAAAGRTRRRRFYGSGSRPSKKRSQVFAVARSRCRALLIN